MNQTTAEKYDLHEYFIKLNRLHPYMSYIAPISIINKPDVQFDQYLKFYQTELIKTYDNETKNNIYKQFLDKHNSIETKYTIIQQDLIKNITNLKHNEQLINLKSFIYLDV